MLLSPETGSANAKILRVSGQWGCRPPIRLRGNGHKWAVVGKFFFRGVRKVRVMKEAPGGRNRGGFQAGVRQDVPRGCPGPGIGRRVSEKLLLLVLTQ